MKRFPFIRIGLIFAFSPILLAFVTSLFQGGSMWNESSGTGAYIWLMFLTLPFGFLLVVIGLVMAVVRRTRWFSFNEYFGDLLDNELLEGDFSIHMFHA